MSRRWREVETARCALDTASSGGTRYEHPYPIDSVLNSAGTAQRAVATSDELHLWPAVGVEKGILALMLREKGDMAKAV